MKTDSKRIAALSLDLINGIFAVVPGSEAILPQAAKATEFIRKAEFFFAHVGLTFEVGYPEVSPTNARFSEFKRKGLFQKDSESVRVPATLYKDGDLFIAKHRTGGFSGNSLHMILKAQNIETLVLFGVATSGIVLSTLRQAADLDYKCVVLKDACYDADSEVHRVLTEKIFTTQAKVLTVDEFVKDDWRFVSKT